MSLSKKLLLGFLIPVLMLIVAGTWSYMRFSTLSEGIGVLLDENDRSIQAANEMTVALERMDSAILIRSIGHENKAASILKTAESTFDTAFGLARGNVTLDGEEAILDSIKVAYEGYRSSITAHAQRGTIELYYDELYPAFLTTMHAIDRLRIVNQDEMYSEALQIADQSYRATLPGLVLVVAAILFTVLFAWLLSEYTVKPLRKLVHSVELWRSTGQYRRPDIHTGDEIQELADNLDMVDHAAARRE
jgi:HAMP domain-containing protein